MHVIFDGQSSIMFSFNRSSEQNTSDHITEDACTEKDGVSQSGWLGTPDSPMNQECRNALNDEKYTHGNAVCEHDEVPVVGAGNDLAEGRRGIDEIVEWSKCGESPEDADDEHLRD